LIVEDQALIGLALEAYLEEVGFGDCETVPSAAEAMEWLSTHTADVVILDYSL
jgi:DNA-binding response OmpR family regulator